MNNITTAIKALENANYAHLEQSIDTMKDAELKGTYDALEQVLTLLGKLERNLERELGYREWGRA